MGAEVRDLERLAAVTRAARRLELEPFLQPVIAAAGDRTGSEGAAILEFDKRGKLRRFLAVPPAHRDARRRPPFPIDESVEGLAIKQCEPLRIPDDKTDTGLRTSAALNLTSITRCLLGLALMGNVPVVLEAVNQNQPDYTEEDVTILETLAGMACLAELPELDRNATCDGLME